MKFWVLFKDTFQLLGTFCKKLLREYNIEIKFVMVFLHYPLIINSYWSKQCTGLLHCEYFFFFLTVQVFPPVNFTLTVSALARVLLRWKPNPNQEQKNYTIRYDVKILAPVSEEVKLSPAS